ncbi:MAG: hypothetical protein J0I65_18555 [Variovorax sp.]|nr:hypothetical protein [Variovorax sp.]|tara:strand:+ start:250 stop:492 length:243 start_codon:yes stop_codon:yes gene_type:complete
MSILAWALITIVALACTALMLIAVALASATDDGDPDRRNGAGMREVLHGLRTIGIVALRVVGVIAALVALATLIVGGLPQ